MLSGRTAAGGEGGLGEQIVLLEDGANYTRFPTWQQPGKARRYKGLRLRESNVVRWQVDSCNAGSLQDTLSNFASRCCSLFGVLVVAISIE